MVQTSTTSLNAARRAADLAALADGEVVDLLVVGLGVTGAGIALDAASRGLTVAALDAHDLAFGTSRWSSKLVHGGLRYLAKLDVGVAMESARERGMLMAHTAPHLTRHAALPAAAWVLCGQRCPADLPGRPGGGRPPAPGGRHVDGDPAATAPGAGGAGADAWPRP